MNRTWMLLVILCVPARRAGADRFSGHVRVGRQCALSARRPRACRCQFLRRRLVGLFRRDNRRRVGDERHGQRDQRQGNRNLSNSAAAVNMTQAQKNEIENRQLATNTYFQCAGQREQAAAARGPPPTMEQLARIAKDGAPKPLGSNQMDQRQRPTQVAKCSPAALFRVGTERTRPIVCRIGQIRRPRLFRPNESPRDRPCHVSKS